MKSEKIPEIDVLIATAKWLWTQRAIPVQFSIAKGQGIDSGENKEQLVEALDNAGVPSKLRCFIPNGPDIIAISIERYWQIECKGLGEGGQSTHRNNFDRAVASSVSYYRDIIDPIIPEFVDAIPTLGLAIPATKEFLSLLKIRLPMALRKRLELWVLLYNTQTGLIEPIEPNREL